MTGSALLRPSRLATTGSNFLWLLLAVLLVAKASPNSRDSSDPVAPFVVKVAPRNEPNPKATITGGGDLKEQDSDNVCPDFLPPNIAPENPLAWRGTSWCPPGNPCPDIAVHEWIARHTTIREEARLNAGNMPAMGSFLACKAMGGIGNYIAGLLSCLATAMATNRSLLLANPPPQPAGRPKYDEPVESLFDFPINMSLEPIGASDVPIIMNPHIAHEHGLQVRKKRT
jgi:hypothetical protein